MITVKGTIKRSKCYSSESPYAVLYCDIGEFAVFDERLKTLPVGSYEVFVQFVISVKIAMTVLRPHNNDSGMITKVLAPKLMKIIFCVA